MITYLNVVDENLSKIGLIRALAPNGTMNFGYEMGVIYARSQNGLSRRSGDVSHGASW